ncbi:MAG: DNA mismatch repair endonuclease MutL [Clostridiales bacterium]|nr:DNA mismatch repair endonuclease MutL [Clostridiales bacterium]
MDRIIILDENTANQIAAGEVIERPASVVKELLENSIDAGSTSVKIEISRGGISHIKITDNGRGILADDVEMAFERHGTSKIKSAEDLEKVDTMGFRGEALPSIASVAKVDLNTSVGNGVPGVRIKVSGGRIEGKQKSSRERGTTISIRNLFFNTPARYKFLKNDITEARYCSDIVSRLALSHTNVSFRYFSNGDEMLRTPGDGNLKNAAFCVYGREIIKNLYEVDYSDDTYSITGFAGNRMAARGNRQNQTTFINGRFVKSKEVTAAVEKAYETEIMKGKFPFYILNIDFDTRLVDVNVHPAKSEVRFAKGNEVFSAVYSSIKSVLAESRGVAAGADRQTRIKRELDYKSTEQEMTNTSFFNDTAVNKPLDSDVSRKLHENLMKTRDSYFGNKTSEIDVQEKQAEDVSEHLSSIEILDMGRFTGILFNTFIMLELNDTEILLIDQHAAHERITYEGLLKRFRKREMNSQILLIPSVITIGEIEAITIENNSAMLKELGFEFDFIGNRDIAIRSIPSEITEKDSEKVFMGAVEAISQNAGMEHMLIEKEAIYTMACKSSVKANTILNEIEVQTLISRLKNLENPYTCPHGRPVIVKLTRRELEKIFKRIV